MAKGGFSKYHWYGLVVPLAAAISPMWLSRVRVPIPQPLYAVLAGAIVAVVTWLFLEYVPPFAEDQALGKAVLLGALATEVLIFHSSTRLPSMTAITLFLFFYFNTVEFIGAAGGGH